MGDVGGLISPCSTGPVSLGLNTSKQETHTLTIYVPPYKGMFKPDRWALWLGPIPLRAFAARKPGGVPVGATPPVCQLISLHSLDKEKTA